MKHSLNKFILIWLGQLISNIGNGMTAFAIGIYVYQESGSLINFSSILLCQFLPAILLRPLGGVLADRYSRKSLIMIGDLGSAIGVLIILFTISNQEIIMWRIYLGLALGSLFMALQNPAYKAIVTDLVARKDYAKVSGLVQLAFSAQHLISPLLAGFLLSTGGMKLILYLDISSFFIAVTGVLLIGRSMSAIGRKIESNVWQDLHDGWKLLIANKLIVTIVFIISFVTFFVGIIQSLLSPLLLSITSAEKVGLIYSISASGMLLTSLVLGFISYRIKVENILLSSLLFAGILMSLLGIFTHLLVITTIFFLFFGLLPLINTGTEVIIRKNIVNEGQGRVWGMVGFVSQIGYLLAYLGSGWFAEKVFIPLMNHKTELITLIGRITEFTQARGIAIMLIISGFTWIALTLLSRSLIHKEGKNVNI